MSFWRTRILLIGATIIMVTGCCTGTGNSRTSAAQGPAPQSEPQQATVVAVDYRYAEAPTELQAGVIHMRFENHGTVDHEMALTAIGDTSFDEWTKWLGGGNGLGVPVPEYVGRFAVPSAFLGLKPSRSAESTFILTPGRYVMWCSYTRVAKGDKEAAHYQLGMLRELIIEGGEAEPELPEADGTITATDYALDVDVEAGDRTINFINEGPAQAHWSTVEVYPKGVDAAEGEEAIRAQLQPGPTPKGFPRPRGLGFSGIFSEGLGGTFELFRGELRAGRTYLFACYMTDRDGRHPHANAYDMYTIVALE